MASTVPFNFPHSNPPAGVTPNFINPPTDTLSFYVVSGVCLGLTTVFASVRYYARFTGLIKKRTWIAESLFALSILCLISLVTLACVTLHTGHGFGKHLWNVLFSQMTGKSMACSLAIEISYPLYIYIVKLCIFLFYLEIFGRLRWMKISCYLGMVVLGAFQISSAIVVATSCSPRHRHPQELDYAIAIESHSCRQASGVLLSIGAVSIASDLFLFLLPMPAIWTLNLPMRKKVSLAAMFLTGSCALGASGFGLHFRILVVKIWGDVTWYVVPLWISNVVEMTAGILILCMPSITAVVKKFTAPEYRSQGSANRNPTSRNHGHNEKWKSWRNPVLLKDSGVHYDSSLTSSLGSTRSHPHIRLDTKSTDNILPPPLQTSTVFFCRCSSTTQDQSTMSSVTKTTTPKLACSCFSSKSPVPEKVHTRRKLSLEMIGLGRSTERISRLYAPPMSPISAPDMTITKQMEFTIYHEPC